MTQPNASFSGEPFSVVEDLDPEPERGHGARRDLLLGIVLLLAVVLFAGWQWWRQDYLSGQYRAGQEAVGRNDWESALLYFGQASGYNDADALAMGAQDQIAERDRLYKSAVDNAEREQWLAALREIRAAAMIEPDYKDLAEREATALRKVTLEAIGGTVVSRENAEPPGLYYYAPSGWVYLEGSDAFSRLRWEASRDGRLVYDMADPGWSPGSGRPPGPYDLYELDGRYLMEARVTGDTIEYRRLALDPSLYVQQIAGKHGLWGIDLDNMLTLAPVIRDTSEVAHLAYQPYESTGIYTVEMQPVISSTGVSGAVVAVDPDSKRYLVADWANATRTKVTADTEVQLYLAEAGVEGRRLIYTHTGGGLQSAQFSPDGRTVVVQTFTIINEVAERQALVLVDLNSTLEPRTIVDIVTDQQAYRPPDSWLSSAFVREGAFAGDLMVSRFQFDHTHVQIIDPDNLSGLPETGGVFVDMSVSGWGIKRWLIASQDADGVVVAGYDASTGYAPYDSSFSIVYIPARGVPIVFDTKMPDRAGFDIRVAPHLFSWLNYAIINPLGPDSATVLSVYSVPRSQPTNVEITPTLAFTLTYGPRSESAYSMPTINLSDNLFAYSSEGKIRVRNYGGTIDVVLESGIAFLYPNSKYTWSRDRLK